jgi:hypothetical protein
MLSSKLFFSGTSFFFRVDETDDTALDTITMFDYGSDDELSKWESILCQNQRLASYRWFSINLNGLRFSTSNTAIPASLANLGAISRIHRSESVAKL